MINPFRAGLKAFLDGMPEGSEVAFITTGGQIRVRTQPTSDMDRLQKAVGSVRAGRRRQCRSSIRCIESDQRFLKKATDRRPVFVMLHDRQRRGAR